MWTYFDHVFHLRFIRNRRLPCCEAIEDSHKPNLPTITIFATLQRHARARINVKGGIAWSSNEITTCARWKVWPRNRNMQWRILDRVNSETTLEENAWALLRNPQSYLNNLFLKYSNLRHTRELPSQMRIFNPTKILQTQWRERPRKR